MALTLLFMNIPAALAAAPTTTSLDPTSGPIGTEVIITGTGFQDVSVVEDVEFNNVDATFSVVSDAEIAATVPAGATDGPIEVTDAEGTAASASNFDVMPSPALPGMVAQPSQPTGGTYRAFSPSSEWNRLLPAQTLLHAESAAIIAEIKGYVSDDGDYPRLSTGAWAEPIYWSDAGDPTYTVDPTRFGPTLLDVHIPAEAQAANTNDAQLTVFDMGMGVVFKLWHATFTGGRWTADGTEQYALLSNGLDCRLPESDVDCPMNMGHRGYPAAIHAVRYDEVAAGVINHVLKVSLARTAECVVFPGYSYESGRGGVLTCEGLIMRLKPSIDLRARGLTGGPLVIARAMKRYGVVVGDTGGNAMTLKVENLAAESRAESWATLGVTSRAFAGKISFDDFQVVA
jgi:IPT/TIG domain